MNPPNDNPTHCAICLCALRRYKSWRDWKGRATHYACYKRQSREAAMRFMYEDLQAQGLWPVPDPPVAT
jgi:hypothetical protein